MIERLGGAQYFMVMAQLGLGKSTRLIPAVTDGLALVDTLRLFVWRS